MRKLCLLFCFLLPGFLHAQKCSYDFDKVDDFTKERSVATDYTRMYIQGRGKHVAAVMLGVKARKEELFVSACNLAGKNLIRMKVRSTDSRSHFFSDKYMLLLENGEIVNLWKINAGHHKGSAISFTSSDAGWSSFLLGVNSKDWASLRTSVVKTIRLPKDEYTNYDIEIEDDDADAIKSGIACIDALHIPNATYESEPAEKNHAPVRNNNPESNVAASTGNGEAIPSALLNKKWYCKRTTNKGGKDIDIESTVEYFANNEFESASKSTIDGKEHQATTKSNFEIANNGKYIIYHYSNNPQPQTFEIVSLDEKLLITKSVKTGEVIVYNKL